MNATTETTEIPARGLFEPAPRGERTARPAPARRRRARVVDPDQSCRCGEGRATGPCNPCMGFTRYRF